VYRKYFKRPLDIVLSIIAIVILFPAFLIIGLLVMIKLGSPIIYKTKRVGKDEKILFYYQ
jgi:undecaprenyl phosphate N,N'-diacetylbacillosamine 1-phosphate transferase